VRSSSESIDPKGFPSTWKRNSESAVRPGPLYDRELFADEDDFVGVPLPFRLLLRPSELPAVALNQHVAFARAAQSSLADAEEIGEPEHVGLHRATDLRLEVRADGDALILGQVLSAAALREARERERRHQLEIVAGDLVGALEDGEIPVARRARERADALRVACRPGERGAVREQPLAAGPGGAAMLPAAADVLQGRARHLEGAEVAEGAPGLDTALLERGPLVGALLDVGVEEVVQGERIDGVALGVDVPAFSQQRVHLALGLGLILGTRVGTRRRGASPGNCVQMYQYLERAFC
jgi:hypothetical protein